MNKIGSVESDNNWVLINPPGNLIIPLFKYLCNHVLEPYDLLHRNSIFVYSHLFGID